MSKWAGLFRISRYITRNGLRILGYHSFTNSEDDIEWQPGLFMRLDTFQKRLQFLQKKNFTVIDLDKALELQSKRKLPRFATVITIDDGWFSTKLYAHEILKKANLPYTIYLTSYYSAKETPIFNLVIQYMFWKTSKSRIDFGRLGIPSSDINWGSEKIITHKLMNEVIKYGQTKLDNPGRCQFARLLGDCLGVDYLKIEKSRKLSLLTASEVSELSADGVDFQLHTHCHSWPAESTAAMRELNENQSFIESATGKLSQHFCYPSGIWTVEQIGYLESAKIKSAVTCDPGTNYTNTSKFVLKRLMDGETKHQIEFEAEISGYIELLRRGESLFKNNR